VSDLKSLMNKDVPLTTQIDAAVKQSDWTQVAQLTAIALDHEPCNANLWQTRGVALKNLQRLDEAETALRRAILNAPAQENPRINLAAVWVRQARFQEAALASRATLAREPSTWAAINLAAALIGLGQPAEAEALLLPLATQFPDMPELWGNLGIAQRRQRKPAALASLRRCLELRPDDDTGAYNLSLEILQTGHLAEGFALMERRWHSRSFTELGQQSPDTIDIPHWREESLAGCHLWVASEQGIGDSIQFSRYLPLLKEKGLAKLTFQCQPPLIRLMTKSFGNIAEVIDYTVRPTGQPDFILPLMSAPHRLGTELATIPANVPYLAVPDTALAAIAPKIASLPRPRIGLCWAGGSVLKEDALRSLPATLMLALIAQYPHVSWISLQRDGPRMPDTAPPVNFYDPMQEVKDFADTAAIVEALDLIISVDTSVAHLAGALGKPVWLLNRYAGEWRWLRERSDSPWYPSMHIFTQPYLGDWESVICDVAAALSEEITLSPFAVQPSHLRMYYVNRSVRLTLPHKTLNLQSPTSTALVTQQIPSDRLYTGPIAWELEQIRQTQVQGTATELPLRGLPVRHLPTRLLAYRRRGNVLQQLKFELSRRHRNISGRPLRLALLNGLGTMLGDNLVGSSAFAHVIDHICQVFGAVDVTAILAWNARPGAERILGSAHGIDRVIEHSVSVDRFCQFDAIWDFSALLKLPGYDDVPLFDFYLDNLGLDPQSVPASAKRIRLDVNPSLRQEAGELLSKVSDRPCLLIHPTASTPLRSMSEPMIRSLLVAILDTKAWQPVVVQPLPLAIASDLSGQYLDLADWSSQSFDHFVAIMSHVRGLVSVDTVAIHIAAALGLPGVVIFSSIPSELRLKYAPTLEGIVIPGADRLPFWRSHKSGTEWERSRGDYERAWSNLDITDIIRRLQKNCMTTLT
jgi:ADP-heptose:LPS heptosyltransferase/Flp pilus assembly protein TadD